MEACPPMTRFKSGDLVTVRSREEILATLDREGRCEGLPFMPQMFDHCGETHRVYRSAHKTCDTVNKTRGRKIANCVHLDLRCDGRFQGGCQAACLLFWKSCWLKPAEAGESRKENPGDGHRQPEALEVPAGGCTEEDVINAAILRDADDPAEVVYSCQATRLPEFTSLLHWWDVRQYARDLATRNVSARFLARGFSYFAFRGLLRLCFWRLRRVLIRIYDRFQALRGGVPYPRKSGKVRGSRKTPDWAPGSLAPGDLVRVRPYEEILATLDGRNKNRGMYFDAEMVPYCGGTYRVQALVERFLDEKTGRMRTLRRPAYILEGVICGSRYSECRLGCPRSIYSWWREIWLEKVSPAEDPDQTEGMARQ